MNKILAFINLDWNIQKLYFKQSLIVLAIGIVISFMQKTSITLQVMILLAVLIFIAYPFALSEKSKLNVFYSTLPINRKMVVTGRFVGSVMFLIISTLLIFLVGYSGNMFFDSKIPLNLQVLIVAGFFIYQFLMFALQTPLYFKFGYEKAKYITYAPMLLIAIGAGLMSALGNSTLKNIISFVESLIDKPALVSLFSGAIALVLTVISYMISVSIYNKKEF